MAVVTIPLANISAQSGDFRPVPDITTKHYYGVSYMTTARSGAFRRYRPVAGATGPFRRNPGRETGVAGD